MLFALEGPLFLLWRPERGLLLVPVILGAGVKGDMTSRVSAGLWEMTVTGPPLSYVLECSSVSLTRMV